MDQHKESARRRLRRKRHIRHRVVGTQERPRLTVSRSLNNIYCQVVNDRTGVTLCSASTRVKDIRDEVGDNGGNRTGADLVGGLIAKRAKELGISQLSFDRNGYRFHGRVKALCEAVRKEGIKV